MNYSRLERDLLCVAESMMRRGGFPRSAPLMRAAAAEISRLKRLNRMDGIDDPEANAPRECGQEPATSPHNVNKAPDLSPTPHIPLNLGR